VCCTNKFSPRKSPGPFSFLFSPAFFASFLGEKKKRRTTYLGTGRAGQISRVHQPQPAARVFLAIDLVRKKKNYYLKSPSNAASRLTNLVGIWLWTPRGRGPKGGRSSLSCTALLVLYFFPGRGGGGGEGRGGGREGRAWLAGSLAGWPSRPSPYSTQLI